MLAAASGAALADPALEQEVRAILERRGVGGEALGIIDNHLRHDAPAPPGVPPLVRALLAEPLKAADAAAIFAAVVPPVLERLADPAFDEDAGDFDQILQRYISALGETQALLRASTSKAPVDDAALVRALREGGLSASALLGVAAAVDAPELERATRLFLEATERFVRGLRAPGVRFPEGGRLIETPIGLVIVGTAGADRHGPQAALIVDPGGDDVYERAPAMGTAVSVIIDLAGNDRYEGSDVAVRAFSAIVDLEGDDRYAMDGPGIGAAIAGAAVVVDLAGNDQYQAGVFGQGAAAFGLGALIDAAGDDHYRLRARGQGYAAAGGLGLLWDRAGNDRYLGEGTPDPWRREGAVGFTQGVASGLRTSLSGGIGILRDDAGDDRYDAQMFAQGTGYYYGLGLLWDRGGNDEYRAVRYAQGNGVHQAVGVLRDESGDDRYEISASFGQGFGLDLAVGVLFDGAGNDRYDAGYLAQGGATWNGFGLLADRVGANHWQLGASAHGWGRSDPARRLPSLGVLEYDASRAVFVLEGKPLSPATAQSALGGPLAEPWRVPQPAPLPACPKLKPAEAGTERFLEAMRGLAPDLHSAGNPDPGAYGAVLRTIIDDPAGSMRRVPRQDFDSMTAFSELLPCALRAAGAPDAERIWRELGAGRAADPATPFAGPIAGALRARPAPPEAMARMRQVLESHPACAVRTAAIAWWGSEEDARSAADSPCWRLQAAAMARLRELAVAPPPRGSRPGFLR